jgi:hypothetical protein
MCKCPLVSIIIPSYNDKDHLRECLKSLQNQEYQNFEVIVVDDMSTDGTIDMIKKEFPNVKFLITEGVGIAGANNRGLSIAKGKYVIFDLNTDDVVSSSWLKNLVEIVERDPRIGVAGGKRYVYGTKIIESAGGSVSLVTGRAPSIRKINGDAKIKEVDYVPVMLVRREILNEVGSLDEEYFLYYEEPDFCLRVRKAGYKIVCVLDAVQWHHGSSQVGKFSARRYYYMRRNNIRFVIKNFSFPWMLTSLLWLLIGRTIIDSLFCVPVFKVLVKLAAPNSLWANCDKRLVLIQFKAILWNFKKLRETLRVRASLNRIVDGKEGVKEIHKNNKSRVLRRN